MTGVVYKVIAWRPRGQERAMLFHLDGLVKGNTNQLNHLRENKELNHESRLPVHRKLVVNAAIQGAFRLLVCATHQVLDHRSIVRSQRMVSMSAALGLGRARVHVKTVFGIDGCHIQYCSNLRTSLHLCLQFPEVRKCVK